ncbi:Uncharacterised protein [Mycobacteroides abscessus subsp. abscessus]|nr:Uncharacterised protein [Mycobacteroides abscessus subsp. abscessus]
MVAEWAKIRYDEKVVLKGENTLGSSISDKNEQVTFLKTRLNMFMDVLDAIDPEEAELEDIDRLIQMIDEIESKCNEFKHRDL